MMSGTSRPTYSDAPSQPYAAPAQPGGRLEYEAYASLARRTIGSLSERARQAVMDVISGNNAAAPSVILASPDPVLEAVNSELWQRRDEYSTKRNIMVLTGTYNVNAKSPDESLLPWVLPETLPSEPDVIALAFQEVVPLTPSQILLTDPSRLWVWENAIMEAINRRSTKQADYTFMRSEQLVGTALLVLIKTSLVHNVRQIESATKKTGLRGMSGNKGGVAIRFKLFDSTLCFVTAHLAAGQTNVEQRNDDYRTISSGLVFSNGTPISAHDHIFWFGDFNYRVDIANERARWLAENDDYSALVSRDQLKRAQESQLAFVGFQEGQLGFRPTYKYDNGTSTYDTSEKQRIPAWTDRVLYRGHGLRQLAYNRAELLTSDHRPVYAFFEAELRVFDQPRRKEVLSEIMSRRRAIPSRVLAIAGSGRELSSSESDDEDLPEPSSDVYNWWDQSDTDSDTSSASEEDVIDNPFNRNAENDRRPSLPSGTIDGSAGVTSKRRAVPPPLPERESRSSSPLTTGGLGSEAISVAASPPSARRVPPPIPNKLSLSSLRMPSSGPASSSAAAAPTAPTSVLASSSGSPARGSSGLPGGGVPTAMGRPAFVRSKSVQSTRSLLTDSE